MEQWKKISLMLCVYGLLKEFRPSEPFVTKYFNNPPMNFTREQISEDIYPIGIYANMLLLLILFLITDLLRYKPIIILNSITGVVIYVMLIVCRGLFLIQVAEVFYGLFSACELAYYTYIYAKVDKVHFQEVTSHTRAAYLVGRAISGITSQLLVLTNFTYYTLNFFTLGGMTLSFIWALFLPSVTESIYFNRNLKKNEETNGECSTENLYNTTDIENNTENKIVKGFRLLWNDFKTAYTNVYLVKWSIWWAIATCGYYQILSYLQLLWEEILKDEAKSKYYTKLNGVIEAAYTLSSALSTFCFGKVNLDWSIYGEFTLFICSIVIGILLVIMSQTNIIWVAYATKIVYAMIYNTMITIAISEVAKHVNPDSYGLIFGFNIFISLILQTVLTFILINTFKAPIRLQFEVYSAYFVVLGLLFGIKTLVTYIHNKCTSSRSDANHGD